MKFPGQPSPTKVLQLLLGALVNAAEGSHECPACGVLDSEHGESCWLGKAIGLDGAEEVEWIAGVVGDDLRPAVSAFAGLMEGKLRKHDATRGPAGWKGDGLRALFARLQEEANELHGVLVMLPNRPLMPNSVALESIASEAADVANFAMMIVDAAGAFPDPHSGDRDDPSELDGPKDDRLAKAEAWAMSLGYKREALYSHIGGSPPLGEGWYGAKVYDWLVGRDGIAPVATWWYRAKPSLGVIGGFPSSDAALIAAYDARPEANVPRPRSSQSIEDRIDGLESDLLGHGLRLNDITARLAFVEGAASSFRDRLDITERDLDEMREAIGLPAKATPPPIVDLVPEHLTAPPNPAAVAVDVSAHPIGCECSKCDIPF